MIFNKIWQLLCHHKIENLGVGVIFHHKMVCTYVSVYYFNFIKLWFMKGAYYETFDKNTLFCWYIFYVFGISKVWSTPKKEAILDKKLAEKQNFSYNGHLYNHYGWKNALFIGSRQSIVKQIMYVKYYCTCGDIGTYIWYQIWKYTMHDISTWSKYSFPKFTMLTFVS